MIYFSIFLVVKFFYLDKSFSWALKSAMASIVVRLFYLQVFVQFLLVCIALRVTKKIAFVFISMLFSFLVYPLLIRSEIPKLHEFFGFGILGNAPPPLLVYFFSVLLAITIVEVRIKLNSSPSE